MNLIEEISRLHPSDAPAVVAGDRVVSYGELFDLAQPIAENIRQANTLGRRPRIGLQTFCSNTNPGRGVAVIDDFSVSISAD